MHVLKQTTGNNEMKSAQIQKRLFKDHDDYVVAKVTGFDSIRHSFHRDFKEAVEVAARFAPDGVEMIKAKVCHASRA